MVMVFSICQWPIESLAHMRVVSSMALLVDMVSGCVSTEQLTPVAGFTGSHSGSVS